MPTKVPRAWAAIMNTSKFRPSVNAHNENVKLLSELSKILKPSVKEGTHANLKAALLSAYTDGKDGIEFKSAKQWKEEGLNIKKNMRAFMFWGSPKKYEKDGKLKSFFPVVYLYSSNQVMAVKN